ncbi:MAG: efflux RND transporter periplasmic adaptor subunit [bacterium]
MGNLTKFCRCVTILLSLHISCSNENPKRESIDTAVSVRVQSPQRRDIRVTLDLLGEIKAQREVKLGFTIGGKLAEMRAEVGDYVEKDQVLARLDQTEIEARLEQAEAAYEQAQFDAERVEVLFADRIATEQQLQTVTNALKQARANLTIARETLKNSAIVAPFSGFVAAKSGEVGEIITPLASPWVYLVVDITQVKLEVGVPETKLAEVRLDQEVLVDVDAFPDTTFVGRVTNISPVLDPVSRTARVEVTVPNPKSLLKPGMHAEAKIVTDVHPKALLVPERAVLEDGYERVVWVVQDSVAKRAPVRVGLTDLGEIEIIDGLWEEAKVVIDGHHGLKEGAKVRVIP